MLCPVPSRGSHARNSKKDPAGSKNKPGFPGRKKRERSLQFLRFFDGSAGTAVGFGQYCTHLKIMYKTVERKKEKIKKYPPSTETGTEGSRRNLRENRAQVDAGYPAGTVISSSGPHRCAMPGRSSFPRRSSRFASGQRRRLPASRHRSCRLHPGPSRPPSR